MASRAQSVVLLIFWIIYFFIVTLLAYKTEASLDKIFIGMLPFLLYITFFVALSFHRGLTHFAIWLSPFIFPLIFFGIWYSGKSEYLNQMDGMQLTIFNIVLSYLINILALLFYQIPKEEKKEAAHQGHIHPRPTAAHQQAHTQARQSQVARPVHMSPKTAHVQPKPMPNPVHSTVQAHFAAQVHPRPPMQQAQHPVPQTAQTQQQNPHHYASQLHNYHRQNQQYADEINKLRKQVVDLEHQKVNVQKQVTRENFTLSLKSIEDKCKAINFVIGRVYSDKKGGTQQVRDKIHIPRELYNSFSQMAAQFKQEHMGELLKVLEQIYRVLVQLELPEKDVIKVHKNAHLPLQRDPEGKDRILDVLARNDQDPIMEYQSESKEIVRRLSEFIQKNYR